MAVPTRPPKCSVGEEVVLGGHILPTWALGPLADMEEVEALLPLSSGLLEVAVDALVFVFPVLQLPVVYAFPLVRSSFVSTFGASFDASVGAQALRCRNLYQSFSAVFSTFSVVSLTSSAMNAGV